ncbi:dihydrodipicolinate synthase family protein [Lactobacillus sp. wkB10]|uniref:dihydrodipicolinate synthase family protein n=1 Tax=Lactobacillus sp. wkB10 TaxID=1545701 RepID=UPI000512AD0E|nr:dihydrodipicolinate synthase family protein [Lactobacillus sp. wkB10]KGG54480.1 4-hydroxy-tetrahydrodipicolinate synthase [Lactobacillus sp. wkB10]
MFNGIITPIVTPFNRDKAQSINYQAAHVLIDKLISAGVSGIFALGSNGEFHVLTHAEKIAFVKAVVQYVDHRVPVFAGAGACSTSETIALSHEMEAAGADALSIINPYFIRPQDDELFDFYRDVAASVDLPVIMYNIPKNTGYNIPVNVVRKLAEIDNIVGIKDSSGDVDLIRKYQEVATDNKFQVLIGSDSKISVAYKMGVKAAIAATSNLIPNVLVNLDRALKDGNDQEAEKLQKSIDVLRSALKLGTVPAVLKRSVELANIANAGPARKPMRETTTQVDQEIIKMLKYYGLHS